jgi:hypothetical protein
MQDCACFIFPLHDLWPTHHRLMLHKARTIAAFTRNVNIKSLKKLLSWRRNNHQTDILQIYSANLLLSQSENMKLRKKYENKHNLYFHICYSCFEEFIYLWKAFVSNQTLAVFHQFIFTTTSKPILGLKAKSAWCDGWITLSKTAWNIIQFILIKK